MSTEVSSADQSKFIEFRMKYGAGVKKIRKGWVRELHEDATKDEMIWAAMEQEVISEGDIDFIQEVNVLDNHEIPDQYLQAA